MVKISYCKTTSKCAAACYRICEFSYIIFVKIKHNKLIVSSLNKKKGLPINEQPPTKTKTNLSFSRMF